MKNINVSIPDDLASRMKELDVNWSKIARCCIRQYIKQRTAGPIKEKIKGEVEDFKDGFYFLIRSIDNFDLKTIEDIANGMIYDCNKSDEFNKGIIYAAKELLFRSECPHDNKRTD